MAEQKREDPKVNPTTVAPASIAHQGVDANNGPPVDTNKHKESMEVHRHAHHEGK